MDNVNDRERNDRIFFWTYLGKYTIVDDNHTDWVSCVRFSPNQKDPLIVSAGWDKLVKVKFPSCESSSHPCSFPEGLES